MNWAIVLHVTCFLSLIKESHKATFSLTLIRTDQGKSFYPQSKPSSRCIVMIFLPSSFSALSSSALIPVVLAMAAVLSSNVSANSLCPKECLCLSQIQVSLSAIYILQLHASSLLPSLQPRKDHLWVCVRLYEYIEGVTGYLSTPTFWSAIHNPNPK